MTTKECVLSRERLEELTQSAGTGSVCAGELDAIREAIRLAANEGAAQAWRPIETGLPMSPKPVLLCVEYEHGARKVIRARFIARFTEAHHSDDDWCEYSEEEDTYFTHEGWYEDNEYEETNWHVNDTPIAWQTLPPPPPKD